MDDITIFQACWSNYNIKLAALHYNYLDPNTRLIWIPNLYHVLLFIVCSCILSDTGRSEICNYFTSC